MQNPNPDQPLEDRIKELVEQANQISDKSKKEEPEKPKEKKPEKKEEPFDSTKYHIPSVKPVPFDFSNLKWDPIQKRYVSKDDDFEPIDFLNPNKPLRGASIPSKSLYDPLGISSSHLLENRVDTQNVVLVKGRVKIGIRYDTHYPPYDRWTPSESYETLYAKKRDKEITLFNIKRDKIESDFSSITRISYKNVSFRDMIRNVALSKDKRRVAFQLDAELNEELEEAGYESHIPLVQLVGVDGKNPSKIEYAVLGVNLPLDEDESRQHKPFAQQAGIYEPRWTDEGILEVRAQLHYAERFSSYDKEGKKSEKIVLANGPPCIIHIQLKSNNEVGSAQLIKRLE